MNKQTHFPSIIATLTSVARTRQLFARKKELNYYSTKDIDKTILPDEFLTRLPITKFILNDVLSSTEYKTYKSLKPIAKSLGFVFVWHSGGRFFERWKTRERAFTFSNITDLHTIRNIYIQPPAQQQLQVHNIIPDTERQTTEILNQHQQT